MKKIAFLILVLFSSLSLWGYGDSYSSRGYAPGDLKYTHANVTTAPGFFLCDGSSYASSTYTNLFAAIATTTLPNFQGAFPKGMGSQVIGGVTYNGAGTNPAADKTYVSLNFNDPGHTHTLSPYSVVNGDTGSGIWSANVAVRNSAAQTAITNSSTGITSSLNTRYGTITEPANVGVKVWIKY